MKTIELLASAEPPADVSEADTASFWELRGRLFGVAYRTLRDAAEAEEIVQTTWIRWQCTNRRDVRDPAAFLKTVATRLALNAARSGHARREISGAQHLPEPAERAPGPAIRTLMRAELEAAVSVLTERLTPLERAAFVLREGFDYRYREVADTLRVSEEYARQLVVRAHRHLACERRFPVSPVDQRELLQAISFAADSGDLARLEEVLTEAAARHRAGRALTSMA